MQLGKQKSIEFTHSLPLIPMASVLVMLLVFLLLGMQMRRGPQAAGRNIQLPNVTATLDLPNRRGPRLEMTSEALFLNDEKIAPLARFQLAPESAPALAAKLEQALAKEQDKRVLIYGDQRMPFSALSALVKQLTTHGISNISLAVIHRNDNARPFQSE